MTLCMHMWNILRFGGWLNFANEHVEYNNRYKITNVHYYGELTHSCEIAYFKVRNFQFFVMHHIFQWLSNQSFSTLAFTYTTSGYIHPKYVKHRRLSEKNCLSFRTTTSPYKRQNSSHL